MEKSELLNGLQEEYRQWEKLLDQIGPVRMDQPGVTGHWSIKDIVAHLTGYWCQTVNRLQAAQHNKPEPPPPWPAYLQTDDEVNAWIYETNHGRPVYEVLDESQRVFQQLLIAIEGLPDKVLMDVQHYLPWLEGNPFSSAGIFSHFHDEHEADIRAWLARVEKQ